MDPVDLYVSQRKFEGKEIQVSGLRCYYADVEDFRCSSDSTKLAVFAQAIDPKESQDRIEAQCDTVKKTIRNATCEVPLRFTFRAEDVSEDQAYTGTKRVVIKLFVVTAPKPNPKYKPR